VVFIIAEIGVNHGGSLNEAYRLVEAARACGADAVKFQAFSPDRLDPPGPRRDMLRKLAFDRTQFACLFEYCEQLAIEFMATPFDVEWLNYLVDLGMKCIKVSSSSIGDSPLLSAIAQTRLPVILSMGLATKAEMNRAINCLSRRDVTLLHCVSEYPADPAMLNLRRMRSLHDYAASVGFSDHSTSVYPPIAAVALGATVIEKHLTLCRDADGPDHAASVEPHEFMAMVQGCREVEWALGNGELFPPLPVEAEKIKKGRDEWRNTSLATAGTVGS